MKSKQVLLFEQMTHLQELGLDTSDGSMCWCYALSYKNAKWELEIYEDVINQKRDSAFWEIIPTYTLQDILDKLPHYLNPFPSKQILFAWMIEKDAIAYRNVEDIDDCLKHFTDDLLIDAAYEMLCWCIENGYIKTNQL
jgi:hypothetical protein